MRRVVITGLGVVTALGSTVDGFWEQLLKGKNTIHGNTRFDASPYRSSVSTVLDYETVISELKSSNQLNDKMNLCAAIGLAAARQALRNAGLDKSDRLRDGGICMGTTSGGDIDRYSKWLHYGEPRDASLIDNCHLFMPANHIAENLGLHGPVSSISSACTSGTVSIAYAYETIKNSDADIMIAGGSDILQEVAFAGFNSLRIVSRTDCNPFDAERTGIILGDGAAFIVLEDLPSATKRGAKILAEIKGVGMSCDARHATAPDAEGAAAAMRAALSEARMSANSIQYINCHGTGTIKNDRAEALAMKNVFGEALGGIYGSSTKSVLGHLLGTAGSIEAVITVLALNKSVIPPMINLKNPDHEVIFKMPKQAPVDLKITNAMNNSFGFGGNNISMILARGSN